mmetsp:Transcript_23440/g.32756  ORF Transcript_23440/g.32756 Transcript_23440/m.32756 type:complete len:487 (-) Transcript_23440:1027-2487(-)
MRSFLFVGFLGFLIAVYYSSTTPSAHAPNVKSHENELQDILQGLKVHSKHGTKPSCNRIAIGYNANLDLIVKAIDTLRELNITSQLSASDYQDHEKIETIAEFYQTFMHFFEKGSAAERFVADKVVWNQIVAASKRSQHQHWFVGGNAALMGNRFAKEGCSVLLGGAVAHNQKLASLLDPSIEISRGQSNFSPAEDEIHLILEYEKGAQWGTATSPRANRFIMHSDRTNSRMESMEPFHEDLLTLTQQHQPLDLLVISGLHLLDGQPAEYRQQRLNVVLGLFSNATVLPLTVPTHVELASIGELSYIEQLMDTLVPHSDSLGLNEQELGSVYKALGGNKYQASDFKDPKVETVLEAIQMIFHHAHKAQLQGRSLKRVHFHCLAFHLIVQTTASGWPSPVRAVTAGSLAATKQACDNEDIQVSAVELHLPLQFNTHSGTMDAHSGVASWSEGGLEYALAPVLVCKKPTKTVGLGDAISAVGLLYHKS